MVPGWDKLNVTIESDTLVDGKILDELESLVSLRGGRAAGNIGESRQLFPLKMLCCRAFEPLR